MCIAKFATGNILLCQTLTVYCNFTLTFLKYTEHYSLRKPMQSVFCLNWLPYQPPLVLLPLATHPTWSEASTPLKRSKLGKVDEALSVFVCVSVSCIHVFIPGMPPLLLCISGKKKSARAFNGGKYSIGNNMGCN